MQEKNPNVNYSVSIPCYAYIDEVRDLLPKESLRYTSLPERTSGFKKL